MCFTLDLNVEHSLEEEFSIIFCQIAKKAKFLKMGQGGDWGSKVTEIYDAFDEYCKKQIFCAYCLSNEQKMYEYYGNTNKRTIKHILM